MSKVQVGIIGCGGMSGGHAGRLIGNPDVRIVSVCDVNTEITARYIENHLGEIEPRPKDYDDVGQLLGESKPDAVVIVTPHALHFEQGMQALDAGCHVLMEKPMVTAADDAYELAKKVEDAGKVFVVGYNTPCKANFYYIRECIRNRVFGRLELVSGYLTQNWKGVTAGTWRQDAHLAGGGQAYDSGAHILNSLCWSVESNIAEVHAFLDNQDTPVDVNSSINIRFENGVLAGILISGNCPSDGSNMAFVFEKGRIDVDGWGSSWIQVREGGERLDPPPITEEMDAGSPDDNLIDAILGRAEPRTSALNGIIQCELMDAIYESGRTGHVARPKRR